METEEIKLKDGWNPDFKAGTQVIALQSLWTIKTGETFEYLGGCEHPEHGWAIILKNCDLTIPGYVFEQSFERILGSKQ